MSSAAGRSPDGVRAFAAQRREGLLRDGALPDGLTMLRAALLGEQRLDYWGEEPGNMEPDGLDTSTGSSNAFASSWRAARMPDQSTIAGVQDRVMNAFDRLLVGYAAWGGYRFHGWTSYEDGRNYHGPVIWSEHDCDLRFAFELEHASGHGRCTWSSPRRREAGIEPRRLQDHERGHRCGPRDLGVARRW